MKKEEWKNVARLLKEKQRYQIYRTAAKVWLEIFGPGNSQYTIEQFVDFANRKTINQIDTWLDAMRRYMVYKTAFNTN